jgi:excisionase family DNA binding protein
MANNTLTVEEASKLMGVSRQFIRVGLQKGILPFGYAVQISGARYTYNIPVALFEKHTGITVSEGEIK